MILLDVVKASVQDAATREAPRIGVYTVTQIEELVTEIMNQQDDLIFTLARIDNGNQVASKRGR